MNLQEPFVSPVRFTGSAEEFYPIIPVLGIFCREYLFGPTRQEYSFPRNVISACAAERRQVPQTALQL